MHGINQHLPSSPQMMLDRCLRVQSDVAAAEQTLLPQLQDVPAPLRPLLPKPVDVSTTLQLVLLNVK